MPTTPAASPSSPSTKFTAFTVATTTSTVSRAPWEDVEGELAAVGHREEDVLDAEDDQEPRGEHLPAELGQRVELEEVVEHPDAADQRARDQHDAGVAEDERPAGGEERQLAGHDVRRDQAAEHGQPTEVRDRLGVHVAVADRRHRPGAQRDLARDDGEQVGHRGGDQEDEGVLPHGAAQPSSVSAAPSGSSTALSCLQRQRAAAQHPPLGAGDVDDRGGQSRRRRRGVQRAGVDDRRRRRRPASPRPGPRRWRPACRCGWPS